MSLIHKTLGAVLCTAAIFFSGAAFADTFSIGVDGYVGTSEYKDMDARILPVPVINYEGERFYFRGFTGGVHLYKDEMHELSLGLTYLGQDFDSSNSDDWAMRQLDDRYSTLLAGASYKISGQYGIGRFSVNGDVLGVSQGFLADAAYLYRFQLGDATITPGIGLLWTSENYNDYYYGVTKKESRKSGLDSYEASDGVSPYLELSANYALTENWNLFLSSRVTYLSDEIQDSPMVNKEVKSNSLMGISYSF